MVSVHETTYPRFKLELIQRELEEVYTLTDSEQRLSALRILFAREIPTVVTLISMSNLELSRVLLPVELTTEGAESAEEINCETREMEHV